MKAITIHPVWAWAIVHGHKRVENRTWQTQYRGPLLIHASAESRAAKQSDETARAALARLGVEVPAQVPTGAIVGGVEISDVVKHQSDQRARQPLATGPWCWILDNPWAFANPVPARGYQTFFEVDAAILPAF